MPRKTRAVLFDLDDTLYPHRRFLVSGFAAVASYVSAQYGVESAHAFRTLVRAYRDGARGHELDRLVDVTGLPVDVSTLVRVMRAQCPSLRLRRAVGQTLRLLRDSYALAIVTNGIPMIQRRKVAALGLEPFVDAVVYATEHGSGAGKPEREPFVEALRRLGVDASRAVFVGDDERADIDGAAACGIGTIQIVQWRRDAQMHSGARADGVVRHIAEVPAMAEIVLSGKRAHHAA
jgi:putative hydrolase of the HAD superfamily